MKRIAFLVVACCILSFSWAQSNTKIKKLEQQRSEIQQRIKSSEKLLLSTKKNVNSQFTTLKLLNSQIKQRATYIRKMQRDLRVVDREWKDNQYRLTLLKRDLRLCKKRYTTSLRYLYKNRSIQEKMLFIFSAQSLAQVYRRMRYMQQFGDFQRKQGEEIKEKQLQVAKKKKELQHISVSKKNLLAEYKQERSKLQKENDKKKKYISQLQKKQKDIKKNLEKHKRTAAHINKEIDRLIELEVKKSTARAEKEQKDVTKTTSKTTKKKPTSGGAPLLTKKDQQLSSVFVKNKGKLPYPITGPSLIVGHFGTYRVEGLRNVSLDNKGIDIQGGPGAHARAIFNGEVSAVFKYAGRYVVLIRHGEYISVYSNLSSVSVKKGRKVKTKQNIGKIYNNGGQPILNFQLRKGIKKLDPEQWLQ